MVPRLVCRHHTFGGLTADFASQPWSQVAPVFLQEAIAGRAPEQKTAVRCAWNETEWRVLFECEDANPWATLQKRDDPLYQEETVEIFLDPLADLGGYFEIEVNPLNTVLDLVFRKSISGYKSDKAWDCDGLQSTVLRTAGGWSAEIAIPFSSVTDHTPKLGEEWRVNFCRIDRPKGVPGPDRELSAWSPPFRNNFHTPERFGVVEFC